MPVLMYGSEFWHLNTMLLKYLESFQADLSKGPQNYSKQHPTANSGLAFYEMSMSLCKAVFFFFFFVESVLDTLSDNYHSF